MLEKVVSILKKAAESDRFCMQLTTEYDSLSLRVEPLGLVPFPIFPSFAQALIQTAQPSQFGRREETLYDPKVRDVWEIPASRIHIENTQWNSTLKPILEQLQKKMDFPEKGSLTAELHNMLIYEPGQFFVGHQDSEKIDGMVATLVVLLPSPFTGGALVVDQHGDKQSFPAPSAADKQLTFMAFYADCHHEVQKVQTGYRIALTYNLVFNKAHSQVSPAKSNPELNTELKNYFSEAPLSPKTPYSSIHPRWLVYLLDHQYTQRSLTFQGLKGADRARVAELLAAANDLGLTAHLALADIHETWNAEEEGGGWRRRRYRRSWSSDYEDEEDDLDSAGGGIKEGNYSLTDLIEDTYILHHWLDKSDKVTEFGKHRVYKEMVCWTKAVDEFKPFQSEYEGFMGNYGNTLDRWYHRAAIILWRGDSEYASLFAIDERAAFRKIRKVLDGDVMSGRSALMQILPQWTDRNGLKGSFLESSLVFETAGAAKNQELASNLMSPLNLEALTKESKDSFIQLIETYGESWGLQQLREWSKKPSGYYDCYIKDLLSFVKSLPSDYRVLSSWVLEYQLSCLVVDNVRAERETSIRTLKERQTERMDFVTDLLTSASVSKFPELHKRLVQHLLAHPRLYPALELAKLLQKLELSWDGDSPQEWGHGQLLTQVRARLEKEMLASERKEGDWSLQEKSHCQCDDCKELQRFLSSANTQKLIWPLAKDRRQHIHSVIDGMDIPVTHVTHHVGSPHKLVLTKTPALMRDAEVRVQRLGEALRELEKFVLEPGGSESGDQRS